MKPTLILIPRSDYILIRPISSIARFCLSLRVMMSSNVGASSALFGVLRTMDAAR